VQLLSKLPSLKKVEQLSYSKVSLKGFTEKKEKKKGCKGLQLELV